MLVDQLFNIGEVAPKGCQTAYLITEVLFLAMLQVWALLPLRGGAGHWAWDRSVQSSDICTTFLIACRRRRGGNSSHLVGNVLGIVEDMLNFF